MKEIEYIGKRIKDAEEYGLLAEVIYMALYAMSSDPEMDIEDAIDYGCNQWDV